MTMGTEEEGAQVKKTAGHYLSKEVHKVLE